MVICHSDSKLRRCWAKNEAQLVETINSSVSATMRMNLSKRVMYNVLGSVSSWSIPMI
jgi:hypothetical protein